MPEFDLKKRITTMAGSTVNLLAETQLIRVCAYCLKERQQGGQPVPVPEPGQQHTHGICRRHALARAGELADELKPKYVEAVNRAAEEQFCPDMEAACTR